MLNHGVSVPDFTLSVVSHGHSVMLMQLLADLDSCASLDGAVVVVTLNLPGEEFVPLLYRRIRLLILRNQQPKGFGANHNAAFHYCDTRWFAVLNPDLRIMHDPFTSLVKASSQWYGVGVIAPRVINSSGSLEDSVRRNPNLLSIVGGLLGNRKTIDVLSKEYDAESYYWLAGMFLLFLAKGFEAVHGFDERFFLYYEDNDICARMNAAGYSIAVDATVAVTHDAQRASHRSIRHLRWHVTSLLRVWMSRPFWRLILVGNGARPLLVKRL